MSVTHVPAVAEICTRFQGAYRAMHLYPAGHSMIESRMQPLASSLSAFLSQHDSLPLQVQESSLVYRGEEVFRQDELRDEMAFMLFREGVRLLTLHAGLEHEELEALVGCFSRAPEATALDQDLVTLLWEQDFAHVDYELVDPLRIEITGEESFEALKSDVRARLQDSAGADLSVTTPGWHDLPAGRIVEIESGVLVGPEEVAVLERSFRLEPRPLDQLVDVLMEMLVCSESDGGTGSAGSTLSRLLVSDMKRGDLVRVLPVAARLCDMRRRRPDRADIVDGILADLADIDSLRRVVLSLDSASRERRGEVETLLSQLAPHGYPALLDLLTEAEGGRARKFLLNTLTTDQRLPPDMIAQRLSDPRWFVVRNMVVLLGATQTGCPTHILIPVFQHDDERVRREVVRVLAGIAEPEASALLRSALDDPSPHVRTAAAHALGHRKDTEALPHLLAWVRSPGFASRGDGEVVGFLQALAELAVDSVVPTFVSLSKNRLLRQLPLPVRVSALRGLAAVGTPPAAEALQKARRSRNRTIRQEAEHCLLELEKRRRPALEHVDRT